MGSKQKKTFIKHLDNIFIDILLLQFCCVIASLLNYGSPHPYGNELLQEKMAILTMAQLVTIIFSNNYSGILQRKKFEETWAVGIYVTWILFSYLLIQFMIGGYTTSARQFILTALLLFWPLSTLFRELLKSFLRKKNSIAPKRSIVLITSPKYMEEALQKMRSNPYRDFTVPFAVTVCRKYDKTKLKNIDIPVYQMTPAVMEKIRKEWVDEVFFLQPETMLFPEELINDLIKMGITVDYTIVSLNRDEAPITSFAKVGEYKVITNNINQMSGSAEILKRLLDIVGSIVGLIFTGIIFLFVAPAIYHADPGPIFFTQDRVGQNGKIFKMYKFRSMYMDAEERKAELQAQNKMSDGMMFKVDDDPRIIGSEKKDKNGKPAGIGNFIRNTSLDEFPQFWNVLKGDMSLVGWRPATLDEWKKYDLEHRVRASMKPGITGMWQVSGRNEITDFDEIVKLDREYIEHWSIYLDLVIIIKTVWVVLKRKGAE